MFFISKFKAPMPQQCVVLRHFVHSSGFDTMLQFVHSIEFGTVVPTFVCVMGSEGHCLLCLVGALHGNRHVCGFVALAARVEMSSIGLEFGMLMSSCCPNSSTLVGLNCGQISLNSKHF